MKLLLNTFIFIFIFHTNLFSQIFIVFKSNDHKVKLNCVKINEILYLSINDIAKIFSINNINVNNYSISNQTEEILFSEKSFFVVYRNSDKIRVAQMSHPTLIINKMLYIPIFQFLNALKGIDLLDYEYYNNQITIYNSQIFNKLITKNDEKTNIRDDKNQFNKPNIDNKNELKEENIEIEVNHKEIYKFDDSTSSNERGKYTIPKKIKK